MSGYIDTENLDCMENDKLVRLSDVIEMVENQCSDGNMWGNENLTLIDARKIIDELSDIPAIDAVPVAWINKHLEWLDNCDNDFAQLAKVGIRGMLELWRKDGMLNEHTN